MGVKYHINRYGDIAECKATKQACKAKPPEGMDQFHSTNRDEVGVYREYQYEDIYTGVSRKKVIKPIPENVTLELIGSEATDTERLKPWKISEEGLDKSIYKETFLYDTEGRAIAYVKLLDYNGSVGLCDVEVREEYRGHKLGQRIIKAAEKDLKARITHDGGYTMDGFKAIYPLFKDSRLEEVTERQVYKPMVFVLDWDKEYTKYPI